MSEPQQWSYATATFGSGDIDGIARRLNEFGADGWELVTSAAFKSVVANLLVFTLKKPGTGHQPPFDPTMV